MCILTYKFFVSYKRAKKGGRFFSALLLPLSWLLSSDTPRTKNWLTFFLHQVSIFSFYCFAVNKSIHFPFASLRLCMCVYVTRCDRSLSRSRTVFCSCCCFNSLLFPSQRYRNRRWQTPTMCLISFMFFFFCCCCCLLLRLNPPQNGILFRVCLLFFFSSPFFCIYPSIAETLEGASRIVYYTLAIVHRRWWRIVLTAWHGNVHIVCQFPSALGAAISSASVLSETPRPRPPSLVSPGVKATWWPSQPWVGFERTDFPAPATCFTSILSDIRGGGRHMISNKSCWIYRH